MKLSESKSIKTGKWYPNEILMDEDINHLGLTTYQNLVDLWSLKAHQKTQSEILDGLVLTPKSSMTLTLSAGAAISFEGTYLEDDVWGFVPEEGKAFIVINPEDMDIAIAAADSSNSRIDTIEIRPVEIPYNSKTRQFKDPITGTITSSLVQTRNTYGFEVHVLTGTPGYSTAPAKTDGWIKLAEVYVSSMTSVISTAKIAGYHDTELWTIDLEVTHSFRVLYEDISITLSGGYDHRNFMRQFSYIPSNLNGHTLTLRPGASDPVSIINPSILSISRFYNGTLKLSSYNNNGYSINNNGTLEISIKNGHLILDDIQIFTSILFNGNKSSTLTIGNVHFETSLISNYHNIFDFLNVYIDPEKTTYKNSIVSQSYTYSTSPEYAFYFKNCLVDHLPKAESPGHKPDYYVKLENTILYNSANLVTYGLGKVTRDSIAWEIIDDPRIKLPKAYGNADQLGSPIDGMFSYSRVEFYESNQMFVASIKMLWVGSDFIYLDRYKYTGSNFKRIVDLSWPVTNDLARLFLSRLNETKMLIGVKNIYHDNLYMYIYEKDSTSWNSNYIGYIPGLEWGDLSYSGIYSPGSSTIPISLFCIRNGQLHMVTEPVSGNEFETQGTPFNLPNIGTMHITALNKYEVAYIDSGDTYLRLFRWIGNEFVQVGNSFNLSSVVHYRDIVRLNNSDVLIFSQISATEIQGSVYRFNITEWIPVSSYPFTLVCDETKSNPVIAGINNYKFLFRDDDDNWTIHKIDVQ